MKIISVLNNLRIKNEQQLTEGLGHELRLKTAGRFLLGSDGLGRMLRWQVRWRLDNELRKKKIKKLDRRKK